MGLAYCVNKQGGYVGICLSIGGQLIYSARIKYSKKNKNILNEFVKEKSVCIWWKREEKDGELLV